MNPNVIITNMKKRYTGVSGTINALMPVQANEWDIGFVGEALPGSQLAQARYPDKFHPLSVWQAIWLSRKKLSDGRPRIWHVRRDPEMMLGIFLRDVLRFPMKLVFTSAAKHRHSWFPRWLISKMNGVIATTPEAASFVPNTTKVVFHGANLERFTPPNDKSIAWQRSGLPGKYGIGLFGRIRPAKGTDIFVDAMIKVLPDFPEFTAIITGQALAAEENYKQSMDEKIRAAGLADRIVFLGNLAADQIPLWYQNVAIMVACPRYEPFGITPLEAMASGCAVVASRTGAFEYIVEPGKTGELIPTDDSDALADAVKKLMSDVSTIEHMGRAGRARVTAEFSIEKEAQGISDVYQAVLNVN